MPDFKISKQELSEFTKKHILIFSAIFIFLIIGSCLIIFNPFDQELSFSRLSLGLILIIFAFSFTTTFNFLIFPIKSFLNIKERKDIVISTLYLDHLKKVHENAKVSLFIGTITLCLLHVSFPKLEFISSAIVTCTFYFLILLKEKIIEYRISRGLFGTNSSEARELIKFIIKNSGNSDFTDSNGKLRNTIHKEDSIVKSETSNSTQGEALT